MRESGLEELGLPLLAARGLALTVRVLEGERPAVSGEDIVDVAECAAFLQARPLTQHLVHCIGPDNCALMLQAAAVYGLSQLLHASALYIRDLHTDVRQELSYLAHDQLDYIESLTPSTLAAVATHSPSPHHLHDRTRTICYLDQVDNVWRHLTALPQAASTSLAGIAVMDNNIYIVGGVDGVGKRVVPTNFCYNTDTDTWSEFPCGQWLRHNVTLSGQDGSLLAIGGVYKGKAVATVESFHVASNAWSSVAQLPRPGEGVACTRAMGRTFVCLWFPMETTDIYEYGSRGDEWSLVTTLRRQQSYGHCMVSHLDNLYVMRNGPADDFLRCFIDCYSLTRGEWSSLAGYYVNSKGALFTATVRGDRVFTVNRMLTLVYVIQEDRWKPAKEASGFPRSGSMHSFLLRLPKRRLAAPSHICQ
ncbi:kelch repeat and BTB domain-containing protein 13 [Rhinoraja longicauda]